MIVSLYIGIDKLDLFSDENIEVVQSVADISDITKNTTDYSKSFTVPASETNNKIFKHYYNADIDNSFDARVKVDGRIELSGMPFKQGRWRLQKVNVKQGKPSSYTIVFWGNGVSLKELIGNDELKDLDWSNENHDYTSFNVRIGLISLLSSNVLYTPLIKRQLFFNSDTNDNINEAYNVAFNDGTGSNGIPYNELKPSIRLIRAIELIESKYNIKFSRDFFGLEEFTSLWFWCNNKETQETSPSEQLIDWFSGNSPYVDTATNIGTFPVAQQSGNGTTYFKFNLKITPDFGYENTPHILRYYIDGNLAGRYNLQGTTETDVILQAPTSTEREAYFTISSDNVFNFQAEWAQVESVWGGADSPSVGNVAFDSSGVIFDVSQNVPKIKIIDLLKGLFNTFKLVVEFRDDTFYVDTFNRYYELGNFYDITRYVDSNSVDVERTDILRQINYKFQEPTTLLNSQYEQNNKVGYGDVEFKLTDSEGSPLDGDVQDYAVPFEQIVYERLNDVKDGSSTKFMYGLIADEELKGVNPKMHLHYVIRETQYPSVSLINDLGNKEELSNLNMASHVDSQNLFSTVFDTNIDEYSGNAIENTLYSNYHQRYISNVFNVKSRKYNYKAKLPLLETLEIKLNDTLKIKGNYFKINNYTTNLVTQQTNLELIKSFDLVSGGFFASPLNFVINYEAQQLKSNVTNLREYIFDKIDNGYGVDWVTVSDDDVNLFFDVDLNSGSERDIFIKFTSTITLQSFTVYIKQGNTKVTADSNTVTADSNEITADNG